MKYILRIFIPDFGKPQKFHDFVFSSPEFERSCFGREFVEIVFFSFPKVCQEKSVLITFISSGLHRKLFLPFILKLFQIQSQINHNPINRFH